MKRSFRFCGLMLVLLYVSNLVLAEEYIGNITVYVKDQSGDNVIDNPHLIGNLTVELWYEEQNVNRTVVSKGDEFVIFKFLNHTGLYTVITKAIIEYKTPNQKCYVGNPKSEIPKIPECSSICLGHLFEYTGFECNSHKIRVGDDYDMNGVYNCESFTCKLTPEHGTISGAEFISLPKI